MYNACSEKRWQCLLITKRIEVTYKEQIGDWIKAEISCAKSSADSASRLHKELRPFASTALVS